MQFRSAFKAAHVSLASLVSISIVADAQALSIDWVTVGNPGNAADTLVMTKGAGASIDNTTGYGSVGYVYRMSKYAVTNAQYVEFLNKVDPTGADGVVATLSSSNPSKFFDPRMQANPNGLAYIGGIDLNMGAANGSKYSVKTGQGNYPATWLDWNNSARFVNWIANGQGAGGTESGIYDLSLTSGTNFFTPVAPTRAGNAPISLPSENEWYKAAYYDPTKDGIGGYWQYATRANTDPANGPPPGTSTTINYDHGAGFNAGQNYLTDVGAFVNAPSAYGAFDMDGNVYTWTDSFRQNPVYTAGPRKLPLYRGASWYSGANLAGAAYHNNYSYADAGSYHWYGFRLASYGLVGDANFDGKVNTGDFNSLAGSFGQSQMLWANGDFDFSGTVDSLDFGLLAANYGNSLSAGPLAASSVPEPVASLLVFTAPLLFTRRSRHVHQYLRGHVPSRSTDRQRLAVKFTSSDL